MGNRVIVGADLAPSCQKSLIPRLDRQAMAPPSLPVDQFQKKRPAVAIGSGVDFRILPPWCRVSPFHGECEG